MRPQFITRHDNLGRVQTMCLCLRMIAPEFEFWVEEQRWQHAKSMLTKIETLYQIKYRPGMQVRSRHTRTVKIDWRHQVIDPYFLEALNRYRGMKGVSRWRSGTAAIQKLPG